MSISIAIKDKLTTIFTGFQCYYSWDNPDISDENYLLITNVEMRKINTTDNLINVYFISLSTSFQHFPSGWNIENVIMLIDEYNNNNTEHINIVAPYNVGATIDVNFEFTITIDNKDLYAEDYTVKEIIFNKIQEINK